MLIKDAETVNLRGMVVERQSGKDSQIAGVDPPEVFKPTVDKPSQLSVRALRSYLKAAKQRGVDVAALALAVQRKYVNPFSVLVMAFIGMPLALAFGRRGAIVALCVAVGVSVAYWGIGGGFSAVGKSRPAASRSCRLVAAGHIRCRRDLLSFSCQDLEKSSSEFKL